MKNYKIMAYQIADSIDLKLFKQDYSAKPMHYSISELFYKNEQEHYLYILSYGVVVMLGYDEIKSTEMLDLVKQYAQNPLIERITEEFIIYETDGEDKFKHNEAHLKKTTADVLKIVMLNVGQSVVLDYYQTLTDKILTETNGYTKKLEKQGKLSMSAKQLLIVIGKTLNVKNNIVDELFVIDQPEETWDDEYLSKVDAGIRQIFDIRIRFKNIDYSLQIVKENLELFKDLIQHNKSNLLEIIIIVLILVEVINLFVEKLF